MNRPKFENLVAFFFLFTSSGRVATLVGDPPSMIFASSGLVAFEAGSYADARIAPRLPAVDEARSRLASGSIAVPREELALAEFIRALR